MALTRANATTAISGIIPASNVNNTTVASISAVPAAITTGALTLISTQTASASASISFTSGLDSTYDSYVFKFINIIPSVDGADFTFNGSTDSGSNYNVVKTTTTFQAYHNEADNSAGLGYQTAWDLAQSTSFQILMRDMGSASDENGNGTLQLFNPSSNVFVKHFIHTASVGGDNTDYETNQFIAGYFNNTNPINAVRFQMDSGTFDGIIKMYGVK